MQLTLAFDVYGTLIDTHGVVLALRARLGDDAPGFSRLWREKQLEYSFRRGLMRRYADFAVCTREALAYANASFGARLDAADCAALLDAYRSLPAFADVDTGLAAAKGAGHRLYAFSNGTAEAVDGLLTQAGLRHYFDDVVSVDEVRSFKPDPAVYAHFLRRAATRADDAWLVSSNPFDVIGAVAAGMCAGWLRRSPDALFDPWDLAPTLSAETLPALLAAIDGLPGR